MTQFFCFMWKKALIKRMQILANYPVPCHHILSDVPLAVIIIIFCIHIDACEAEFVRLSQIYESDMWDVQEDGSLVKAKYERFDINV